MKTRMHILPTIVFLSLLLGCGNDSGTWKPVGDGRSVVNTRTGKIIRATPKTSQSTATCDDGIQPRKESTRSVVGTWVANYSLRSGDSVVGTWIITLQVFEDGTYSQHDRVKYDPTYRAAKYSRSDLGITPGRWRQFNRRVTFRSNSDNVSVTEVSDDGATMTEEGVLIHGKPLIYVRVAD